MARLADLETILLARLRRKAPVALDAYGTALAQAIAEAAPVDTGALRASVQYEADGETAGAIMLRKYGLAVDRGHRVARWGTSRRPRAQSRPFKTGGTVPANPFLARGMDAPSVRAARSEILRVLAQE